MVLKELFEKINKREEVQWSEIYQIPNVEELLEVHNYYPHPVRAVYEHRPKNDQSTYAQDRASIPPNSQLHSKLSQDKDALERVITLINEGLYSVKHFEAVKATVKVLNTYRDNLSTQIKKLSQEAI